MQGTALINLWYCPYYLLHHSISKPEIKHYLTSVKCPFRIASMQLRVDHVDQTKIKCSAIQ